MVRRGDGLLIKNLLLQLSRKYQFMEVSTTKRAAGLKEKIPDIQKTLATVQFLQKRKVSFFFFCNWLLLLLFLWSNIRNISFIVPFDGSRSSLSLSLEVQANPRPHEIDWLHVHSLVQTLSKQPLN